MRTLLALAALATLFDVHQPRAAEPRAVDLELILAVDISGSVDEVEARLQRQGYVQALTDPMVVSAITSGVLRRIAVAYVEWADADTQALVVPWHEIGDAASARRFADRLAEAPYSGGRYTSISGAIRFALPMFDGNGFDGTRRVIDVSGDGPNNTGELVTQARDAAVAQHVTVNGLPIVNDRPQWFGPPMPDLDLYYINCVIGGPGAFIVVAENFEDFAVAIRRKLILEIAGAVPAIAETGMRLAATRETPPCDAGERRLRRRLFNQF